MSAVVVGAGHSGEAACRLLRRLGARVRLLDRKAENVGADFRAWAIAAGVEILAGEHEPAQFAGADAIVLSPGVPAAVVQRLVPEARIGEKPGDVIGEAGKPELLAETELAWRQLGNEPLLGVTGTSGKTTTATLCAAMLAEQGRRVFLGGNIGTPLSRYVLDVADGAPRADALVLELSSFQLQACSTLRPHVGVLLGVAPNHLDYHADMREYVDAKMRMFRRQDERDVAVLAEESAFLAEEYRLRARREIVRLPDPPRFSSLRLLGPHNQRNAETAWIACREFGVSEEAAKRAAAAQPPIEHRLELIAERGGVLYVNDSKCTTVTALKVALEAFDRPVLLLAGGKFKGGDLGDLRELLRARVRAVGLYGAYRDVFEAAWQGVAPLSYDPSLEQAVLRLADLARSGDVVLLAPATASFDQYVNYMARGDDFRRIIERHIAGPCLVEEVPA
jgi:UDP-N-acetylmuramoylalanine--D-glutamate ligase